MYVWVGVIVDVGLVEKIYYIIQEEEDGGCVVGGFCYNGLFLMGGFFLGLVVCRW